MKAFFGNALLVLCFTSAICVAAQADTSGPVSGGVIHFHGQIVEGACNVDPAVHNVTVSCYRNGTYHENSIPVGALARGEMPHLQDATVSMAWLNQQKTLAVISVQYQ